MYCLSLNQNFSRNKAIALIGILVVILNDVTGSLPASLTPCKWGDEDCYVKQGQTLLTTYSRGIPDRNVPSIEPVELGRVDVQIGSPSSSINLNLILTNTSLHNFGGGLIFKSIKMRRDPNDLSKPLKAVLLATAPKLEVHANHEANGKMLVVPISSKGKIVIKLNQFMIKVLITFQPEKRADGQYYLTLSELKLNEKFPSGSIYLTNLFSNNEELSKSMLKVLNDEFLSLSADVTPEIMKRANIVLKKTLQSLFDTMPYNELFKN